jgi:hypothetical protein
MFPKAVRDVAEDLPVPQVIALQVFPNPASRSALLELRLEEATRVAVEVVDLAGRVHFSVPSSDYPRGQTALRLDLAGLSSGMYFCSASAEHGRTAVRLLVVK